LKEDGVTGTTATLLYLAAASGSINTVGNHCGDDVIMTGTTALLLYLAATFGSMALGGSLPYRRKKGSGADRRRWS
jgi:hypothetical protein